MLLLALTLSTGDAYAQKKKTEVGTSKTTGIGVNLGSPNAFTAKFWLKPKAGVSLTVGKYFLGSTLVRVQYEQVFYTIGNWDWGKLDLYWNAGGGTRVALVGLAFQPGVGGGVSAMIRFKDVPAEVFIDNSIYLYPAFASAAFNYGYVGGFGGRWYF